ncbi:ABC transporter substrate-binding protein [Saccharothrix xinjiangensis]|uniref:ABC transporter substrate-binding protein n=1 Tax=Saccharothrix xinjiangensis TaxID=204798 RepID=A0ABV9XV25_9PSEU
MSRRALAAPLTVALLAGCAAAPQQTTERPRALRVAAAESVCSVRPGGFTNLSSVSYGFAELLVRPKPDGSLEPWLAESFSRDGDTTWRFKLRSGVKFHNGRDVDAAAVVAGLKRHAANSFVSDAVTVGQLEVAGPMEFTLTTTEPAATGPNALASIFSYPVYDAEALEQAGDDERKVVEAGVYTGPYRPTAIEGDRITAQRHEGYWGDRAPYEEYELRCVADAQARLGAVRAGEVDLAFGPPTGVADVVRGDDRLRHVRAEVATEAACLQLNLNRAPFDQVEVRRAFLLAVDYDQLAADLPDGLAERAEGLYPRSVPWHQSLQRTDADEAGRLLDAAGWQAGPDGVRVRGGAPLKITYLWSEDPTYERIGLLLRDQLRPVGFDVELRQVEAHYDNTDWPQEWNLNVNPLRMEGLGNDPGQVLLNWFGAGGQNFGGVQDAELNALVDRLGAAATPGDRDDLLRQAERLAVERGYASVLVFRANDAVAGPGFHTYRPDPKLLAIDARNPSHGS